VIDYWSIWKCPASERKRKGVFAGVQERKRVCMLIQKAFKRLLKLFTDIVYSFGNTEPEGGIKPSEKTSSDKGSSGNSLL